MAELAVDPLAVGESALAAAEWDVARAAFEGALAVADTPQACDGLGRSLWWIEGPAAAVVQRTRAYAGFSRAGDAGAAAHVAVWLAHEYAVGLANPAAASGWLTRAAGLLQELPEGADHARLELVRGATALDPIEVCRHCKLALEIARRIGDRDLEITALGRLGLAEVRVGAVESGMSRMDEAMAAALGGETAALETLGQVCCDLIAACDQTGDVDRLRQWNRLLDEGTRQRGELPVLSFCGCCSAETLLAGGQVDAAERELARAVQVAQETGSRGRCVDPRSRLADMLVRQGRFEEAEQLLPGADGDGWTVRARAELQLARGEPGAAVVVLERRLRQIGDTNLLAVTVLDLLVQARIAEQEREAASVAAAALEALAEASGNERLRARACRRLAGWTRARRRAVCSDGHGTRGRAHAARSRAGAARRRPPRGDRRRPQRDLLAAPRRRRPRAQRRRRAAA